MKYFYLLVLWLFVGAIQVSAQYDSLIHKRYADRIDGYVDLYLELLALKDSAAIAQRTEKVKQFARKQKDRDLELEMDLFLVYHDAFFKKLPPTQCIDAIKELIERSEKEKIDHITIRAIRVLAQYYWEQQSYEQAFEQYIVLDKKLSTQNVHDFPELVRDLLKIGEAYYFFHDYTQAKSYFERIIQLPETDFNSMFINSARNTLGLCYQKEKNYSRSDYYFNQILKTNFSEPKRVWRRIALGNLGANCYYRKEYDKAIPLLEYDFDGALKEKDYGPAAGASTLLADIYLSRGNLKKSWDYLVESRLAITKVEQPDRLQYFYPIMSKWYSAVGKNSLSQIYLDSTVVAINNYHETYNARKVLRAQQKIMLQEDELRLAEFALEKQRKTSERNALIIIVAGLCGIIVLGYFIQKKRQLAKDLKIQAATKELEIAQLTLAKFTQNISEKNRLIEQLQKQHSEDEKIEVIGQLQQSSILTEEDWIVFQRLFDKAYPGFIHRTKEAYPDLSLSELRYFVLSKLNLSYREMAAILGVSPNTVQVSRHRIRKRLNFPTTDNLEESINRI